MLWFLVHFLLSGRYKKYSCFYFSGTLIIQNQNKSRDSILLGSGSSKVCFEYADNSWYETVNNAAANPKKCTVLVANINHLG